MAVLAINQCRAHFKHMIILSFIYINMITISGPFCYMKSFFDKIVFVCLCLCVSVKIESFLGHHDLSPLLIKVYRLL